MYQVTFIIVGFVLLLTQTVLFLAECTTLWWKVGYGGTFSPGTFKTLQVLSAIPPVHAQWTWRILNQYSWNKSLHKKQSARGSFHN